MTEHDETTTLRRWLWLQRIVLLSASAAGVLALAIIQASDQTSSPRFVLLVTIGGVFAGGLIGAMVATTVMTRRGIPVRRPRSTARFVAIFGIALLLWLILSLLAPRLGLHSPYLGAALFAVFPLLGLLATELVDGNRPALWRLARLRTAPDRSAGPAGDRGVIMRGVATRTGLDAKAVPD